MTHQVDKVTDYILGGIMFLSAPFIPSIAQGHFTLSTFNVSDYNDIFTLIIQGLSIVLLSIRVGKALDKNPKNDDNEA